MICQLLISVCLIAIATADECENETLQDIVNYTLVINSITLDIDNNNSYCKDQLQPYRNHTNWRLTYDLKTIYPINETTTVRNFTNPIGYCFEDICLISYRTDIYNLDDHMVFDEWIFNYTDISMMVDMDDMTMPMRRKRMTPDYRDKKMKLTKVYLLHHCMDPDMVLCDTIMDFNITDMKVDNSQLDIRVAALDDYPPSPMTIQSSATKPTIWIGIIIVAAALASF